MVFATFLNTPIAGPPVKPQFSTKQIRWQKSISMDRLAYSFVSVTAAHDNTTSTHNKNNNKPAVVMFLVRFYCIISASSIKPSAALPSQCLQRLARGSPSDPVLTGMVQLRGLTRHPFAS